MAKKGAGKAGTVSTKSSGEVAGGKKKSVSRADKAGLTMSVSKVHAHMLKKKMHPNTKGVTRVSASAPVYVTAAIEYFAAELLEQAGNMTIDTKQKGGPRKRITVEDIIKALRGDAELDKATTGLRILVGDKIKGKNITAELLTEHEKKAARDKRETSGGEE